jgi:hypothetical protein
MSDGQPSDFDATTPTTVGGHETKGILGSKRSHVSMSGHSYAEAAASSSSSSGLPKDNNAQWVSLFDGPIATKCKGIVSLASTFHVSASSMTTGLITGNTDFSVCQIPDGFESTFGSPALFLVQLATELKVPFMQLKSVKIDRRNSPAGALLSASPDTFADALKNVPDIALKKACEHLITAADTIVTMGPLEPEFSQDDVGILFVKFLFAQYVQEKMYQNSLDDIKSLIRINPNVVERFRESINRLYPSDTTISAFTLSIFRTLVRATVSLYFEDDAMKMKLLTTVNTFFTLNGPSFERLYNRVTDRRLTSAAKKKRQANPKARLTEKDYESYIKVHKPAIETKGSFVTKPEYEQIKTINSSLQIVGSLVRTDFGLNQKLRKSKILGAISTLHAKCRNVTQTLASRKARIHSLIIAQRRAKMSNPPTAEEISVDKNFPLSKDEWKSAFEHLDKDDLQASLLCQFGATSAHGINFDQVLTVSSFTSEKSEAKDSIMESH